MVATRRCLLLLIAAILLPALLLAQVAAAPAVEVLTLEQALMIADKNNQDIQKALEYENWIRGKYVEARAQALPQFNFFATARRDYDNTFASLFGGLYPASQDSAQLSLSVNQPIYTFGKIGAAIKAASFGFDLGRELVRQARQTTRRDVTSGFYDVLLAQELYRIAAENEQLKQRQFDNAKQRYELGTATDYDVLTSEVDWRNSRPAVISAQNLVVTSKRRLLFLLGRESGEIDVKGTLEAPTTPPPTYTQVIENAMSGRPDLLAQQQTVNVYYELIKIAKAGNKPSFDFNGSYGKKFLWAGDVDVDGRAWGAGVTFNWPFFNGLRTNGQAAQAVSDWNSAKIDEAKLRDAIAVECKIALDRYDEALELLNATTDTVSQAERLLQMAEKGFELGVKIRLEVDDAQLNLARARGSLASARHDYLVAIANLQWAEGLIGE